MDTDVLDTDVSNPDLLSTACICCARIIMSCRIIRKVSISAVISRLIALDLLTTQLAIYIYTSYFGYKSSTYSTRLVRFHTREIFQRFISAKTPGLDCLCPRRSDSLNEYWGAILQFNEVRFRYILLVHPSRLALTLRRQSGLYSLNISLGDLGFGGTSQRDITAAN